MEVTNNHFVADLSDQTGQLERVRYRREHGLELYAGGKGHGEPPTIDWSNDYVDQDHYQKLRIRNWASPPNYEVIRGPLCVRVRHWGFPHSPIHPVFTPSRMHIDQTYVFYAGKDYFLKEGKMEAAKDFDFTTRMDLRNPVIKLLLARAFFLSRGGAHHVTSTAISRRWHQR
ncbi:hypothetical protein EDM76_14005 [bacterium]|nr:MAG: hypothetical protein EDM76_14005 [bacterium]